MVKSTGESTLHEFSFTEVIERVKQGFGYRNDAELARAIGMSASAFSNRKKSGSVPYEEIIRAANQRNMDLALLFGPGGSVPTLVNDGVVLKAYTHATGRPPALAGTIGARVVLIPRYAEGEPVGARSSLDSEVVVETLAVNEDFIRANRLIADRVVTIQVCESSMSPTLEHGDQVIVDRSVERVTSDGLYAIRYAGTIKIKRLQMRGDGSLLVLSDNPSYQPEMIAAGDPVASLVVIGRVLPYKFGRIKL